MQRKSGKYFITGTWTNSSHQSCDVTFNNHIKSCDDIFNQHTEQITEAMRAKAVMLINNCNYVKNVNGERQFKFLNGLDIIQSSSGQTKYGFYLLESCF